MKLKLVFAVLLMTTSICLGQDYSSIKGKTWVCTNVTSKMKITKSNYLNQTLTLHKNGDFNYIQDYKEADLKNEINGTYIISKNGDISFPTSKLTVTMNGSTSEETCMHIEKGTSYNMCMLNATINIIDKNSLTITYKGSKDSEIQEDLILTYTLK
jgi:archaellum component FlaF (FlaF/FlaG flagellin family)